MLSIIIPVFNGAAYLERLFASLAYPCRFAAEQNLPYELIFVDDGSTDDTLSLLQAYATAGKYNMKICSIRNSGVSAARNKGLSLAEGEYIAFLDCDDTVSSNYFAAYQRFTGAKGPAPEVVAFQSARLVKTPEPGTHGNIEESTQMTGLDMLFKMAENPTRYGVYNFFYQKKLLKELNMQFATGYAYYEDYDFLYRLLARTKTVCYTETVLYYYLLQEGSAVASFRPERLKDISLLKADIPFLAVHAPTFLSTYRRHVINRIYWSVMWQAALAFPTKEALYFGRKTHMGKHMLALRNYKDPKVRFSAKLYVQNPLLFILAARTFGKQHSRVGKTDWQPFADYFQEEKQNKKDRKRQGKNNTAEPESK